MKKSIEQKKQEKDRIYEQVRQLIGAWQNKAQKQRKAFLLLYDNEVGEWDACMCYNKRHKYPMADLVGAFAPLLADNEEFYNWMLATIKYVSRNKAKAAKKLPIQKVEFREQDEIKSE